MNLFVLPSWYPSAAQPVAGLFVREQVDALVALRDGPAPPGHIVVGSWGHHDGALSLRNAAVSCRALAWRVGARSRWCEHAGWAQVITPRLSWTLALAGGGAAGLLSATRRNLALATARFGRMDLLHAHVGFPAGWIASVLARECGLPYVLTEHMSPFPIAALMDGPRPCVELRQAYAGAAATIAVGPALAARIRELGLPCSDVVPNVVDETRFVLAPAPPPAPFIFFTLGALTPQKGVDVLLEALALMDVPAAQVQLHIGGDGPQRATLQAQAARLGLTDHVRWLGALAPRAAPAAFAHCHAFVLASRHETFGVVLAEALMCGRPVVATRSGGPDGIVNHSNGMLVPTQDAHALAEAMRRMVQRAASFDAQALRDDALRRFSRAVVALQLRAVYARVLRR